MGSSFQKVEGVVAGDQMVVEMHTFSTRSLSERNGFFPYSYSVTHSSQRKLRQTPEPMRLRRIQRENNDSNPHFSHTGSKFIVTSMKFVFQMPTKLARQMLLTFWVDSIHKAWN
jgi:hypothetical protein